MQLQFIAVCDVRVLCYDAMMQWYKQFELIDEVMGEVHPSTWLSRVSKVKASKRVNLRGESGVSLKV